MKYNTLEPSSPTPLAPTGPLVAEFKKAARAKATTPARSIRDPLEDDEEEEKPAPRKKVKFDFPDMLVNEGKGWTWEELPHDKKRYVSTLWKLSVRDGKKKINPGAPFPIGEKQEMIRVRCLEPENKGEILIILKSAYPEQVLGATEVRWRTLAADIERGVTISF